MREQNRVVHGGVKLLFRTLGAGTLGVLLISGFLVWRLGQGPLSLSMLTPYLEDALSAAVSGPTDPVRFRIGGTEIAWANATRELELNTRDVTALNGTGDVLARFSKLGLSLDPTSLLAGKIRPTAIDIYEPHLRLIRDTDGQVRLGLQNSDRPTASPDPAAPAPAPAPAIAPPASPSPEAVPPEQAPSAAGTTPNQASPENSMDSVLALLNSGDGLAWTLQTVSLTDADVEIIDRINDIVWDIPALSLDLRRDVSGLSLSAEARIDLDSQPTTMLMAGQFRTASQTLAMTMDIDRLRPAALAPLHPDLSLLSTVDFPLSGRLRAALSLADGLTVHRVDVDIKGGAGTLRTPAPLDTDYPLRSLRLLARYDLDRSEVVVDTFEAALEDATVSAVVSIGPKPDGDMAGTASVSLGPLTVETLKQYWPVAVAPNPRDWVVTNLIDGRVSSGTWTFTLDGPGIEHLDVTDLEGYAQAEDVSVTYLPPMPPATNARGELRFFMDRVELHDLRGQVGGSVVTDGTIRFTDLDKADNFADIRLSVDSPLTDALTLLDSPPLGYPRKLGLDPKKARGDSQTSLSLSFPLLNDLPLDDLKVKAETKVSNGFLQGMVFGQDLSDGDIALVVDTSALDAEGSAKIGGVPMDFTWRENFAGKPFASRYTATAQVAEDKRSLFGLTFPPFTPDYIGGPVTASLVYTIPRNRPAVLDVQADLTGTRLWIPGFEHEKPPGQRGAATAQVLLKGDRVLEVSKFHVSTDTLELEGAVALTPDQDLKSVTLTKGRLGESVLSGTMIRTEGLGLHGEPGFTIDVRGPVLDATPFLGSRTTAEPAPAKPPAPLPEVAADGSIDDGLPPLLLRGFFDTVITAEDLRPGKTFTGRMTAVQASANRSSGRWQTARIDANVPDGSAMTFILGPDPENRIRRRFTATTANAGAVLRAVDIMHTMRGGALQLQGTVTPQGVADGTLSVDNYRLVDAPVLAKLLSVAALTGILDSLTGEGIAFDRLEAPFTFYSDQNYVQIRQFRTFGSSLGLTGSGAMDFRSDVIEGTGTMVPFFMVNSLVGKIPLLGDLLTGFEKDGGLFAAGYSVKGSVSDPSVSVNPLSALAPGFLRRVFTFDFSDPSAPSPPPGLPPGLSAEQDGVPQETPGETPAETPKEVPRGK